MNRRAAKQHLRALNHAAADGATELVIIRDGKILATGFFDNPEALVEAAAEHDGQANVYLGVNPRPGSWARNKLGGSKRASDEDIEQVVALFVDLDPADRAKGELGTDEQHQVALEAADGIAQEQGGTLIDSGGGGYVLCHLAEPVPLADLLARVGGRAAYGEAFRAWYDGIAERHRLAEQGLKLDSVFEPSRIHRLAGTRNTKGPGRATRFVRRGTGAADLDRVFASGPEAVSAREPVEVELPAQLPAVSVDDLRLSEATRQLIRTGEHPDQKFPSRSEAVGHVVCAMLRTGHSQEQIAAVLLDRGHEISRRHHERANPERYVAGEIARSMQFLGMAPAEPEPPHEPEADADRALLDAHDTFAAAVPDEGFFAEYRRCVMPSCDAPQQFIDAGAIVAIGVALGRSLRIPYGTRNIYPNLYACLVAPSSRYRKSSAIAPVRKILRPPADAPPLRAETTATGGVRFSGYLHRDLLLPEQWSAEAFFDVLARQSHGCLLWDELGAALARLGRSYMAGSVEFLAEVYDSPEGTVRRVYREKEWEIRDPCLSILSTTTGAWLRRSITEADVVGGFLPRWLLVGATRRPRLLPMPAELDDRGVGRLRDMLGAVYGQFPPDERVAADLSLVLPSYEAWIRDLDRRCAGIQQEEAIAAFLTRLQTLALKVALILQVGRDPQPAVTVDTWDRACHIADYLAHFTQYLVTEELSYTRFGERRKKALDAIRAAGARGIRVRDLHRRFLRDMTRRERDDVLEALVDEGSIWTGDGIPPEKGPVPKVAVAAEHYAQFQVLVTEGGATGSDE